MRECRRRQAGPQPRALDPHPAAFDSMKQASLIRCGLGLEYATLGWNAVGTVVLLVAAARTASVALSGFGLDSAIEIFASVVVVWQLKGLELHREKFALRLIGASLITLAIYILGQSLWTLLKGAQTMPSQLAIIWLVATCVAMVLLAWGKLVVGRQLGNPVLVTEARVTLIDGALAGAVLAGVVLNALVGWWWADPIAGLVIVLYGFAEGPAAWKHGSV